jgi:hypothetical protein
VYIVGGVGEIKEVGEEGGCREKIKKMILFVEHVQTFFEFILQKQKSKLY